MMNGLNKGLMLDGLTQWSNGGRIKSMEQCWTNQTY